MKLKEAKKKIQRPTYKNQCLSKPRPGLSWGGGSYKLGGVYVSIYLPPVKINLHSSVLRLLVLWLEDLAELYCCVVSACVGLVHGGCGLARSPFLSAGEGKKCGDL